MTKNKQQEESPIMRRADAAKFLKLSIRGLDYLVAAKEVPHKKAGKRLVLFDKESLTNWVRNG